MGEAKRKRQNQAQTVYHHTSTLRTNLIWMSGVIQVEGKSEGAFHPQLGKVRTDATMRRPLKDFPPVAWFTTHIEVPKVLMVHEMVFVDKVTGEPIRRMEIGLEISNAYALQRLALGFPVASIPAVPWPEYYGYLTPEGQELNETAREKGNNPDDWYLSESPVDVLQVSEFWCSRSILKPKLRRDDGYIRDIRRMVTLCRERKAYILPTWLNEEQAQALARRLGLPVVSHG
jgi:hypothetical protein